MKNFIANSIIYFFYVLQNILKVFSIKPKLSFNSFRNDEKKIAESITLFTFISLICIFCFFFGIFVLLPILAFAIGLFLFLFLIKK